MKEPFPPIKLPLLGVELDSGDVNIFPTVADAQSYIESYDLATWQVYDADGLIMSVSSNGETKPVTVRPTGEFDRNSLQKFIEQNLEVLGKKAATERARLESILEALGQ
jgi:hypothetical protein